ncbi:hypothetical protein SRHO_G00187070 [Serrasalmus rhombeus]
MAVPAVRHALRQIEKIEALSNSTSPFKVKVQGRKPIRICAGTLSMVPVTCPQLDSMEFLLEPLDFDDGHLPEGLLLSPAFVSSRNGLTYAPIVNVSDADVWLPPRHVIGTVQLGTVTSMTKTSVSISPSWDDCCAFVSVQEMISGPEPFHGPLLSDIEGLTKEEMTALNAKTRRDAYPLPRIEESLDALVGAKWFSTLDLASGYNQVPVAEKDKFKTAFCTPFGLFEFNRMPFGLCNAPATFQRLMERMFGDCRYQSVLLYLDDVIVFSANVEQHLERLGEVFSRLQKQGLKVKLSKCHFFQRQVNYLGHVVSREGVATDPAKIEVVKKWKRPSHLAELRSFLGFASYYRRFVEGFSKLAAPLHQLVGKIGGARRKGKTLPISLAAFWDEVCEQAFQSLKERLTSAPVLAYADFSKPFVVEVDASHGGLGAVLSQEHDGKVRPIAFASRGLRPAERNMDNYSSMKLELLAVKWAVTEKFREYLLGNKFTILTDNNPLSHLQTAKLGATEQRWAAQLAAFNFTIKYRPGKSNQNADALSRQYVERFAYGTKVPPLTIEFSEDEPADILTTQCREMRVLAERTPHDLYLLQEADPVIGPVCRFRREGRYPRSEERNALSSPTKALLRQWDRLLEREKGSCIESSSHQEGDQRNVSFSFQSTYKMKFCLVFMMLMDTKEWKEHSSCLEVAVFGLVWPRMWKNGASSVKGVCWGKQFNPKFEHFRARCKRLALMRFWQSILPSWNLQVMVEKMF